MALTEWVPTFVMVATVVGQGFVVWVAVSRHEKWLERHDAEVHELNKWMAVQKDRDQEGRR